MTIYNRLTPLLTIMFPATLQHARHHTVNSQSHHIFNCNTNAFTNTALPYNGLSFFSYLNGPS